jgi:lysophospholipase L1-like esterase
MSLLPLPAAAQNTPQACVAAPDAGRFVKPLARMAQRLRRAEPITIVALGSSSTAGAGASSPALSYPSRLEDELRQRFPRVEIRVLNRGVNGEEAPDMLARLDRGVIDEKPDLVIWQVGTNAVLRDRAIDDQAPLIHQGLMRFKEAGIDVVLIDPQFAPKVLARPAYERMVSLIATAAKQDDVDLFHRFAVMRYWRDGRQLPFESFLSADLLHMNDWSYGCVAKLLAGNIAEAATRGSLTAGRGPTTDTGIVIGSAPF